MSTEIKTELQEHTLTQFWGGNTRGVCAQVTVKVPNQDENGYICLTMVEAAELSYQLVLFVKKEAERRKNLLEELPNQKELMGPLLKTGEIMTLDLTIMDTYRLFTKLVDATCPKYQIKPG